MTATQIHVSSAIDNNLKNERSLYQNIKKVLLAEDDDDDFNFFNAALLSLYSSMEVLRTKNGIMLTSLIETSIEPDIIILDLNMPYKKGTTCLQEIKNKPRLKEIKVVIYTSSCSDKDIEACYNYGADFYLVKPNSFNAIVLQFRELFSNDYFINNIRPPRDKFVTSNSNLNAPYIQNYLRKENLQLL